ncbi:Cobalamin synthesis protein/P47K family protein [Pseudomonas savastanoi pv. phaseolicola]|uniref:Cobalamin synthesis protein/P47K family protein n=3 Tax=Pseudomonas TaxID=286 RepID=A0ABD4B8U4_PSESH|nr:Cobalamin synthesis protein/P47K family protein [Pseudomonas savastanoi pv. phaseolicola]RMQ67384.1 Cobalamin synthesis protein/P47K protein [Pseudomonas savastanoi pv. glycinea]
MQKLSWNRSAGILIFSWQTFTSSLSAWLWTRHASAHAVPELTASSVSARRTGSHITCIITLPCSSMTHAFVKSDPMLQNIPTHVIGGPLGAGKTSLIKRLLAQKPAHERWAVLINEFGQIGLDAALLTTDADGIALGEVAGGCLCCVNGVPFQIGLGRLLRKARPDRLLIEPSGLGHPAQLMAQLREAPWRGVLNVQPGVVVLDAQAMLAGQPLPSTQQEALADAGLVVMNKSEQLDEVSRLALAEQLLPHALIWTRYGELHPSQIPGFNAAAIVDKQAVDKLMLPNRVGQLPALWVDPKVPICLIQTSAESWSIGWRWHPSQRFDLQCILYWLESIEWRRAKMVIHSEGGWYSGNVVDGAPLAWQISEWRQDSRLELIFSTDQDVDKLQAQMVECLA